MNPVQNPVVTGRVFDPFKLAGSGDALEGTLDVGGMPRLADRVATDRTQTPIHWRMEGSLDARSRPQLTVHVEGSLWLVCQRCMQPFPWALEHTTTVLLARDEDELERLDVEEAEVVLATPRMSAQELVEDELVLTVPFSPRHPEGECPAAADSLLKTEVNRPFAALDRKLAGLGSTETKE
jgi:uncharacterized protein